MGGGVVDCRWKNQMQNADWVQNPDRGILKSAKLSVRENASWRDNLEMSCEWGILTMKTGKKDWFYNRFAW